MEMLHFPLVVATIVFTYPQNTNAQRFLRPSMKVVPAVIRQSDSVRLTCALSQYRISHCFFCIKPVHLPECFSNQHSDSCNLALSGNYLFTWSHQSGIAEIELSCLYNAGTQSPSEVSPYSASSTVIVVGPPQLQVSPQLISETDTVHLTCLTPHSPLVSQCFFLVGGKPLNNPKPSCQLQSTGKDFIHWSGVRPPAQISLSCYYTVTTPQLSSDPSQPVSITVGSGRNWITAIVIFMFVGGLITFFLCLKTGRCAFSRILPSTAAASVMTVGLDHDQDSVYHVYSSISDAPNCSNQKEIPYSLIQEYRPTHIQSTQQENDIDSVVQIE
ncbi:uncharacterized protein LOC143126169 isoform X2 [Alosa pseudoharengus]|uniref:uncharacterized protein LOC143126169 isoform X2 n=1 Tax=Alosa pseudoharengus TaxID=34774 RepID=UPI003F8BF8D0